MIFYFPNKVVSKCFGAAHECCQLLVVKRSKPRDQFGQDIL